MSKIKRFYYPDIYALIDGVKPCDHSNYDDYFEMCEDCHASREQIIEETTQAYYERNPEADQEEAERIRDGLREEGINV